MPEPITPRDASHFLATLAAQLERDRRTFVWGNAIYAAGNLILAGLVWGRAGGTLEWLPAAIAFTAAVFYALTAEWELQWQALWRRELPRIEDQAGIELLSAMASAPVPRRLARWLKWLNWTLAAAWLLVLLAALRQTGLSFGSA